MNQLDVDVLAVQQRGAKVAVVAGWITRGGGDQR